MTSSRDPIDVPTAATPSHADLDATDRLLDQLSNDASDVSSDPALTLLRAASSAPDEDELTDRVGFAQLVARAATPTAAVATAAAAEPTMTDPTTEVPTVAVPLVAASTAGRGRLSHVRRALAAKVAIVIGVTVLGVAGAGAATGIYRAATSPPDRPTETSVTDPTTSGDLEESDTSNGTDGAEAHGDRPFWSIFDTPTDDATDSTDSTTPGSVGAEHGVSPNAGGNPDPGSNGAANGNSPNAGGNPDPGSNGAANGNSPNAGGNPDPGSNGAANGNSPNAGGNPDANTGGNPDPGSNGAANGNSPNAGGNPDANTGGNPDPGSNGAANGNSPNAGGAAR